MKIAITGSTGLIGTALVSSLRARDHHVVRVVREPKASGDDVSWSPTAGTIDARALDDLDAVVHLAGESVAEGRWTAAKKERIRASRVHGTRLLCDTLAATGNPPRVLVSASAIGYYGDRGSELLSEDAAPGAGFLSEVCQAWEAAADPARAAGIRVVHPRIGVVLSSAGGALAKMLTPFRLGLGGVIGSGQQYMSWITIDDLVGLIDHAIASDAVHGPINAVAPEAVTNREFTRSLGAVLRRPTFLPMPAFAARMAFGEMADALLLASIRVSAERAVATGYPFRHATLETALRSQVRD